MTRQWDNLPKGLADSGQAAKVLDVTRAAPAGVRIASAAVRPNGIAIASGGTNRQRGKLPAVQMAGGHAGNVSDSQCSRPAPIMRQAGFTLLEVLVAVLLLTIIITAVYSSFFAIFDATTTTGNMVIKLQEARATMDLMRREIEAAMPPVTEIHEFEVRDRDVFGKQASALAFDTNLSPIHGGARILYEVRETGGEGRLSLFKVIGRAGESIDMQGDGGAKGAAEVEAVENLASFTVEAGRGREWLKTWQEPAYPRDIRVVLTIIVHGAEVPLEFTARPYVTGTL